MKRISLALIAALAASGWACAQDATRTPAPGYPRVTAYFGPPDANNQAQLADRPTPGGFYRMALGPDGKGCHRYQDFYQDNGARQTNEATTCDPDDLMRWDMRAMQGLGLGYRPTGQLRSRQFHVQSLPDGRDQYYDDQGRVRSSFGWRQGKEHGPFHVRDASGQLRIEGVAHLGQLRRIRAWDHGRQLSRDQAIALYNQARVSWFADMFR